MYFFNGVFFVSGSVERWYDNTVGSGADLFDDLVFLIDNEFGAGNFDSFSGLGCIWPFYFLHELTVIFTKKENLID